VFFWLALGEPQIEAQKPTHESYFANYNDDPLKSQSHAIMPSEKKPIESHANIEICDFKPILWI
jgi:hypothetical protein